MKTQEDRGLDFRPPRGESPRDLQERLHPWLKRLAEEKQPTVAICHKGVIRAVYALARGWDMTVPPPEKLCNETVHCFRVRSGVVSVERLNIPLAQ